MLCFKQLQYESSLWLLYLVNLGIKISSKPILSNVYCLDPHESFNGRLVKGVEKIVFAYGDAYISSNLSCLNMSTNQLIVDTPKSTISLPILIITSQVLYQILIPYLSNTHFYVTYLICYRIKVVPMLK